MVVTLAMTTFDCARPAAQASFWAELLGWDVAAADDAYAMLTRAGAPALGFGAVPGWQPPAWPDEGGRKRVHLDLSVDDLDTAQERCLALGATVVEPQPQPDRWRVLRDPDGLLFCLARWAG